MRSPALAVKALKVERVGTPSIVSCICVACGTPIAIGDLASPPDVGETFMDGRLLLTTPGEKPLICGDCSPFFRKNLLMKIQKAIITEKGVYPIGKGEFRAWFILNPPPAPFSVVFSNAKLQHLLWRTPVTQDPDRWLIQLGPRTLSMRRKLVLAADAASKRIGAAFFAATKKQLTNPFLSLDPELRDLNTGKLRPDVHRFALANGLQDEIALLESLKLGEFWGLCAVIFRGGIATQPEPYDRNKSTESDSAESTSDE